MRVRVTVPATSANLGPGFDCLAVALDLRNEVEATLSDRPQVDVVGEGQEVLPRDEGNAVYRAAQRVAEQAGARVAFAFRCTNRIPLDRGLGSSAAARVAGAAAANRLLGSPLPQEELVRLTVDLEGHPDNAVAAWLGGLVVAVQDGDGRVCWQRVTPGRFPSVVLCVPELRVPTEEARARLPAQVSLHDAVFNTGRAALLVAALCNGDFHALGVATQDRLHQPYREDLIPGFRDAVHAARQAGAWGAALSGAGSTVLAFCPPERAPEVGEAMKRALWRHGVHSRWMASSVDERGVLLEDVAGGGGTWDG